MSITTLSESRQKTVKEGMLCYLAGVLFPIIYLSSEPYKSNRFVRFHSFQSIVFTLTWVAVLFADDFIQFQMRWINTVLSDLWLIFFLTWIVLMVRAYRGQKMKLPIVGHLAERWAG